MKKIWLTGDMNLSGLQRSLQADLAANAETNSWSVSEPAYNSWQTDILDPQSRLYQDSPDYCIVVLSPRALDQGDGLIQQIEICLQALKTLRTNTQVLFTNLLPDPVVPQPFFVALEQQKLGSRVNQLLHRFQEENLWFQVLDFVSFASLHGFRQIGDSRYEAIGRMYLSPKGATLFSSYCMRALRAINCTPRKVLVLDLDNTLWGGVLGEEGPEGIQCGGDGAGYAFLRFQRALLKLKENGTLLAICSKNNEADVVSVFRSHPNFCLKLTDFAAYRINWDPKTVNLRSLAEELNLGLQSFVFFDDSPHECESVRQGLPMVDVLQAPTEPAEYVRTLFGYPGLDIFRVTDEDRKRSKQYMDEAQRQVVRRESSSLEDFYRNLDMRVTFALASNRSLARIHQLIHKTSQFNLTAERLGEPELHARITSPDYVILTLTLQDRLGESGMTGLAIIHKAGAAWHIENLLMSCRIIGRTVEFAFMKFIVAQAARAGATTLHARFVPNERNQVASNYLAQCGFTAGQGDWVFDIAKDSKMLPDSHVTVTFPEGLPA